MPYQINFASAFFDEAQQLLKQLMILNEKLKHGESSYEIDEIFNIVSTFIDLTFALNLESLGDFLSSYLELINAIRQKECLLDAPTLNLMKDIHFFLKKNLVQFSQDDIPDGEELKQKIYRTLFQKQPLESKPMDPGFQDYSQDILVVDDDESMTSIIKLFLKNFSVITTASPQEALDLALEKNFALMITDFSMPIMNGMELLHSLHKQGRFIPTIFISGKAEKADIIPLISLGIVDYIDKPLGKERLLMAVHNAMNLGQSYHTIHQLSLLSFKAFADARRILMHIKSGYRDAQLIAQLEQRLEIFDKTLKYLTQNGSNVAFKL